MEYVESGTDITREGEWTKSLHGMINHITRMTGVPFDEKVNAYDWFLKNVNQLENERTRALFKALKPIQWDWSSSIRARQNLVTERFRTVNTILPFLTKTEKKLVKEWKKENNSSDLWD